MPEAPFPPRPRPSPAARATALAVAAAWCAAVLVVCVNKWRAFLYADFDLAIFAQAVLGVAHGRWFSSIRGMPWLGDHASLLLVALAPLGAVARSALLLPEVQAIALAATALPLFVHARRRFADEPAAAALVAAWLLQPALAYLALFEFHPETLAVPALVAAAAALASERPRAAVAWAAVAALAREDVALPLAVMGGWAALRAGPRRAAGLAIVGVGLAALAADFAVLRPLLTHGEADYGAMYARWGRGPLEIARAVLGHPGRALAALVATPGDAADTLVKRQYWLHLLGPWLGLPLLAPGVLLPAAPVFAEHFLSSRSEQHTILYQYTALVLPFTGLAAAAAIARLGRGRPARARALAGAAVLAALAAQFAFGPLAPHPVWRAAEPEEATWPDGRDRAMARWRAEFQRRLPPAGVVVADFPSLAPLAGRDSLHSLHHVAAGRYTYSSRPYPAPEHVDAMLADLAALESRGEIDERGFARLRAFVASRGLRVTDMAGGLLLLAPGADTLAWLEPLRQPFDRGDSLARVAGGLRLLHAALPSPEVRPGERLEIRTTWLRDGAVEFAPLLQWTVMRADGPVAWDGEPARIAHGLSDVRTWPAAQAWVERDQWVVPDDLPPGTYELSLTVWRHGLAGDAPAPTSGRGVRDGSVWVGRFRVPGGSVAAAQRVVSGSACAAAQRGDS
jgi:hypothetical protein